MQRAILASLLLIAAGALWAQGDKPGQATMIKVLPESWSSPREPADDVDSVAFWKGGRDRAWAIATTKGTHQLLVYDADTGRLLQRVGGPGTERGRFQRPNGIQVIDDWVLVAERDNHRIQVLQLPGFESLGFVGADELRRPYGLTIFASAKKRTYELYVTDNYETAAGEIPPDAELGERVKHFRLERAGGGLQSSLVRAFGETSGPGILRKVETLLADPELGRLLVAEEQKGDQSFRIYDLEGRFLGEHLGQGNFRHEPEGLALWRCGKQGYWLATDQAPSVSYFQLYDRKTLAHLGTFIGKATANTDGVGLTQERTRRFRHGAFFAVHDDQGLSAFDWDEIAHLFWLKAGC